MRTRPRTLWLALVAGSLLSAPSAQALTLLETANLHMLLETASQALSIVGRHAAMDEDLAPAPAVAPGTEVFRFNGTYSDTGWSLSGDGQLSGQAFTLSFTGGLSLGGDLGRDLVMAANGQGQISGRPMSMSSSAAWQFNTGLQGYDRFLFHANGSTEADQQSGSGFFTRLIRWVVEGAEMVVTYVATEVVRIGVAGATAPTLGPGAIAAGIAAGNIVNPHIENITKTASNAILNNDSGSSPPDDFIDPEYPDGPDGDGPGRHPISTLVDPVSQIVQVNNPEFGLLATGLLHDGQLTGQFVTAVPEPRTSALLFSGLALLAAAMHRRKPQAQHPHAG